MRACVEWKKPFKSLAQQTTPFAAPRVLRLCYCVVRACVERKKKNYSNPLLSKLRDFPRRVVCSGVFVIRTCVCCPNTKILRESVRCPVCSLSELFVNRSPTVFGLTVLALHDVNFWTMNRGVWITNSFSPNTKRTQMKSTTRQIFNVNYERKYASKPVQTQTLFKLYYFTKTYIISFTNIYQLRFREIKFISSVACT